MDDSDRVLIEAVDMLTRVERSIKVLDAESDERIEEAAHDPRDVKERRRENLIGAAKACSA
jgi:hypothetical protein